MDHFESIIKTLLEVEGYWVKQSFKVNLTKEEKRMIGKPSIPRPEIDLLAFKPITEEVLAIEAKSYLDSYGIGYKQLIEEFDIPTGRYKLFTCSNYREIIFSRLKKDLLNAGLIEESDIIRLGLVAGNVYQNRSEEIRKILTSKGWFFWSPEDVRDKVNALASKGYENDPAIITAKILLRNNAK